MWSMTDLRWHVAFKIRDLSSGDWSETGDGLVKELNSCIPSSSTTHTHTHIQARTQLPLLLLSNGNQAVVDIVEPQLFLCAHAHAHAHKHTHTHTHAHWGRGRGPLAGLRRAVAEDGDGDVAAVAAVVVCLLSRRLETVST